MKNATIITAIMFVFVGCSHVSEPFKTDARYAVNLIDSARDGQPNEDT